MASMALDPSSALAEKYKGNRQILEQAVLGRGGQAGIDPYSALRALQKLNVADKYEQMQRAMQGQPNMPSVAQQTLAQAQRAPAPAPQAAPTPAPQAPQSGGLAAMPVPEDSFNMAGGGLVAFADGGDTDYERKLAATNYYIMPEEERTAFAQKYMTGAEEYSKPEEYYGNIAKQIEDLRATTPEELEQQKGLAALQAAAALSQGNNLVRGLGAAGAAFGQTYGQALSEAKKEKRALTQMQMQMEEAKRKERMDLYKEGRTEARAEAELQNKAREFAETKWKALMDNETDRAKVAATLKAAGVKEPTWQNRGITLSIAQKRREWEANNPGKEPTAADEDIIAAQGFQAFAESQRMMGEQKFALGAASAATAQAKVADEHMRRWRTANLGLKMSNPNEYARQEQMELDRFNRDTAATAAALQGKTASSAEGEVDYSSLYE